MFNALRRLFARPAPVPLPPPPPRPARPPLDVDTLLQMLGCEGIHQPASLLGEPDVSADAARPTPP